MEFNNIMEVKMENSLDDNVFDKIINYLEQFYYSDKIPEIGMISSKIGIDWIVQKGEFTGTWPKRFAKMMKQERGVNLTSDQIGVIGGLVKEATIEQAVYYIDFDKDIDWRSGSFGDSGSCYWTSKAKAKDLIKANGGFAIRLYHKSDFFNTFDGVGRAWIVPIKLDGYTLYVMWNAYGRTLATLAKIFATHMNLDYQVVTLKNNGTSDGLVWINDSVGCLFGPKKVISSYIEFDMILNEEMKCYGCGENITGNQIYKNLICQPLCANCFAGSYDYCASCGEVFSITLNNRESPGMCNMCKALTSFVCDEDGKWYGKEHMSEIKVKFISNYTNDLITFNYTINKKNITKFFNRIYIYIGNCDIKEIYIDEKLVEFETLYDLKTNRYSSLKILEAVI